MSLGRDYPLLDVVNVKFPRYRGKPLRPTGALLHMQVNRATPSKTLITPERDSSKMRAALAQAKVLAVGPDVDDVKAGDVVLYKQHEHSGDPRTHLFKDGTVLYEREAVVCVVEAE